MFATGLPQISLAFFSAASEAVVIPTGVQIFVFIATLLAGRVIFGVPMLFGAGGLAIFIIGRLTGVMVALAPFDWQAHDTYFIVAHLHYVLIGGMLFPVVAGLYYFYPLLNGEKLSDRLGKIAFWLMFMFAGFNIAFFPMHLTGLRGMPRRVFTYPGSHLGRPALCRGRNLLHRPHAGAYGRRGHCCAADRDRARGNGVGFLQKFQALLAGFGIGARTCGGVGTRRHSEL